MDDKKMQEIAERLTRIETLLETKFNSYEAIKEKADAAYTLSLSNAEEIKEIKANNKWAWRTIMMMGVSIIAYFLSKAL